MKQRIWKQNVNAIHKNIAYHEEEYLFKISISSFFNPDWI
jgi:hypothetical protein